MKTHTILLLLCALVLGQGCEKLEEPKAPVANLEMRDNLGSWHLRELANTRPIIRFSKGLQETDLLQLEFSFIHSSRESGILRFEIIDTEIKAVNPIMPIELRIPEQVNVFLKFETSPEVWGTNKSENVLFRITKLTEFEGEQYASGDWFLKVFYSSNSPSDLEIRGTFENFKVQID